MKQMFWIVILAWFGSSVGDAWAGDERLEEVFRSGDWEETVALCDTILADSPRHPTAIHHKGYALHALGRLDEALEMHLRGAELPSLGRTCAYNAACAYALKGDADHAIEWLTKAIDLGFEDTAHIGRDADLASLKSDARFQDLMVRLVKGSEPAPMSMYTAVTERGGARLTYFDGKKSPGQVHLDWGKVAWNDAFGEQLASGELDGRRWRFGQDFWTNLDASLDLTVGDAQIPAGHHFLTLERKADGRSSH